MISIDLVFRDGNYFFLPAVGAVYSWDPMITDTWYTVAKTGPFVEGSCYGPYDYSFISYENELTFLNIGTDISDTYFSLRGSYLTPANLFAGGFGFFNYNDTGNSTWSALGTVGYLYRVKKWDLTTGINFNLTSEGNSYFLVDLGGNYYDKKLHITGGLKFATLSPIVTCNFDYQIMDGLTVGGDFLAAVLAGIVINDLGLTYQNRFLTLDASVGESYYSGYDYRVSGMYHLGKDAAVGAEYQNSFDNGILGGGFVLKSRIDFEKTRLVLKVTPGPWMFQTYQVAVQMR